MTKLYKLNNDNETFWCFAPNKQIASKTIIKELFNGQFKQLTTQDVTDKHIKEDGVEYLIKSNFIGIPKKLNFMLNGSMAAISQHYDNQKRSGVLWYSDKIPGSREVWS